MTRDRTIGTAVLAAAAVAVGAFLATGTIPDAPPGATVYEGLAQGPCEVAQALAADPLDCQPGELVTVWVQVPTPADGGESGPALPPGLVALEGTHRPVANPRRPDKALTVVAPADPACIVGEWVRTTESHFNDAGTATWDGRWQTSWCCGAGCACAGRCVPSVPVLLAGSEDAQVRRALCRAVPAHGSCAEAP